jgi:SAM-dependent methyltransferase
MDVELTNTLTLSLLENATAYNQWICEKIRPYLKGNVLEVGCGIGNLTGFLLKNHKVIVSDMNDSYLKMVEKKYGQSPNLQGMLLWDIEGDPPTNVNMPIDTILCSNVLEHIKEDEAALKKYLHLLPEGGRLILLVPALKFLYNALDKELGHFRRYNRSELTQKLTRNGFRICSSKYFNFFSLWGWFINGTLLRRRILPAKQVGLFNKMVPLFMGVEKIIPAIIGQSLIIVGEKGSVNQ